VTTKIIMVELMQNTTNNIMIAKNHIDNNNKHQHMSYIPAKKLHTMCL